MVCINLRINFLLTVYKKLNGNQLNENKKAARQKSNTVCIIA